MTARIDDAFLAASQVYGFQSDSTDTPATTVKSGESTLSDVAKRLGVDLGSLLQANPGLSETAKLQVGQDVRLPRSQTPQTPTTDDVGPKLMDRDSRRPSGPSTLVASQSMAKMAVQMNLSGGVQQTGGVKPGRDTQYAGPDASVQPTLTPTPTPQQSSAKAAGTKLIGMSLGENQSQQEVKIKREIGASAGYENKLQAVAVARMAHAEPAAVVRIGGKWHAVETTAAMEPSYYNGEDFTRIRTKGDVTFTALPSTAAVEKARNDVISLRARAEALQEQVIESGNRASPELNKERDEAVEKLSHARLQLASLMFGVDESEVQNNISPRDDTPGKINIDPLGRRGDPLGEAHYQDGKDEFEPGLRATFGIKLDELENPDEAAAVMFHELSHVQDAELAQQWVAKYTSETGRMFVGGPAGRKPFEDWMKAQAAKVPPRLSKADAEMVVDRAENDRRTTEARAFVHATLAALQAGNPEQAKHELVSYAGNTRTEHHKSGDYRNPKDDPTGHSLVQEELTRELQEAYRHMPNAQQQQLRDAIAAAKKANPEAWISQIKLPN